VGFVAAQLSVAEGEETVSEIWLYQVEFMTAILRPERQSLS